MTNVVMSEEARELYSRDTTASLTAQLVKHELRTLGGKGRKRGQTPLTREKGSDPFNSGTDHVIPPRGFY